MRRIFLIRSAVLALLLGAILAAAGWLNPRLSRLRTYEQFYAMGVLPRDIGAFGLPPGIAADFSGGGEAALASLPGSLVAVPRRGPPWFGHAEPDRRAPVRAILRENECAEVSDVLFVWRSERAGPGRHVIPLSTMNLPRPVSATALSQALMARIPRGRASCPMPQLSWNCGEMEVWLKSRERACR